MTDPYIQINGTKIEVFDNDLSAIRTIKQLDEDTTLKSKIITATRDMTAVSGDVVYTGLDFTPTAIQCIACINGTFSFSVGFADSAIKEYSIGFTAAGIASPGADFIALYTGAGAYQGAVVKTYNTGVGFTLTWTKGSTPTGTATLYFLCFR